jgi:hypothetical protein
VRHVARHRFLTTQHFRQLVKGGEQGIARRLQTLYHAGVLDRPKAQLEYFHRGGSKPMVYGLGGQGARMLCARGEKAKIDWRAKNRNTTKLFIEHTLRVADFMVSLEVACERTGVTLNRITTGSYAPHWSVQHPHATQNTLGVIPDAVFELNTGDGLPVVYCLEADRATMPIKRRHLHQSSVARKLLAYHATWKNRVVQQRFGWIRFRVLTLTTSPERVGNLRAAANELPGGHGLFLFSHEKALTSAPDALSMLWQEPTKEAPVTLLSV